MRDLTERVRQTLQAAGAARSPDLQQVTGASQASISRALAPLLAAGEVLKVGRARSQAYDMPRQGFIGRAFAHARKDLRLADNPEHWTDDDVLKALCQAGEDLPGNLIL